MPKTETVEFAGVILRMMYRTVNRECWRRALALFRAVAPRFRRSRLLEPGHSPQRSTTAHYNRIAMPGAVPTPPLALELPKPLTLFSGEPLAPRAPNADHEAHAPRREPHTSHGAPTNHVRTLVMWLCSSFSSCSSLLHDAVARRSRTTQSLDPRRDTAARLSACAVFALEPSPARFHQHRP